MNRHSFIDTTKTQMHCSVCFNGPKQCKCIAMCFTGVDRLVNGEPESSCMDRVSNFGPNWISGDQAIATNTFFYVSGRDSYATVPSAYELPSLDLNVHATGPMFPIT